MSQGAPNCLICGAELVYANEATEQTCSVCGKKEMGKTTCAQGHYVCNACHRAGGVEFGLGFCLECDSTNAIEILQRLMSDKSVYPNGPEHHTLIGAAVMTAYVNAGGKINGGAMDLAAGLKELEARSLQVPGGSCGFWGCCGSATSVGQALSVINGSTPLARDEWAQCQRLTSTVLGHLADLGGPRCCKRTGFTAVLDATDYLNEHFDVSMQRPDRVTCTFCAGNAQCLHEGCPYFPKKQG